MKIVERIKDPIYEEMELFEKKFAQMMSSEVPLLNRITYFIVKRKGKQIRPMLVFLIAKMTFFDSDIALVYISSIKSIGS